MQNARAPLTIGWQAVKANALPGLLLQTVMLSILLAYYFSPRACAFLAHVAEFKSSHGLVFVIVTSICAASILPELFVIFFFQGGRFRAQNLCDVLFTAPFWGIDGVLVDLMYRSLGDWLGAQATASVVAAKICIDQFGYNPFFAAPYGVWGYAWKNSGYSWARLRPLLTWDHYRNHVVPVLIATWAIWIPLMAIIYSLPVPLQFPMFALALSFWVLLMTYMTNRFAGKVAADAELALPVHSTDGSP